ncbi:MAG: hypothetical protein ACRDK8_11075, partial [Solirubrobacteraceae bacterium]
MSSRSLIRRPRPIPPRSTPRPALTLPRGGVVSRLLPAAVIAAAIVAVLVVAAGRLGAATSSAR